MTTQKTEKTWAEDWDDFEGAANAAAGNWADFDSFAWWGKNDLPDPENWCLVYTHNRDSDLVGKSNAAEIEAAMAPFTEPPEGVEDFAEGHDCRAERHSHCLVGWVDGYAIRTRYADGRVTEAFKTWCDLKARLADYPLLNEQDHSEREYDEAIRAIREQTGRVTRQHPKDVCLPAGYESEVFSYLWDHNQRELENTDGTGAYPSEESVEAALDALGYLPELGGEPGEDDLTTDTNRLVFYQHGMVALTTTRERWAEDVKNFFDDERIFPQVWERDEDGEYFELDVETGGYALEDS